MIAVGREGFYEVPPGGAMPVRIITHKRVATPSCLPAPAPGRTLLYVEWDERGEWRIVVQSLKSGKREVVVTGYWPWYSPTGHMLYGSHATIWALPFSLKTLRATGDAFPVASPAYWHSVGDYGTLAFLDPGDPRRQLAWRDRSGNKSGVIELPFPLVLMPRLSPDGSRVAVITVQEDRQWDVAVVHLSSGLVTRLTSDLAFDDRPTWSPKGDRVVYASGRFGNANMVSRAADGSGGVEKVLDVSEDVYAEDWSVDGRNIVFNKFYSAAGGDIWYLRRKGAGEWEEVPFLVKPGSYELDANFSPDGRYVAYESNESGRYEVYVRQFPQGGGPWQVSTNGGQQPRWRRDGRELYYVQGDALMAVDVTASSTFSIGTRKPLFACGRCFEGNGHQYDVTADGRRFLVSEPVGDPPKPVIRVVQNWFSEFRDKQKGSK